MHYYSFYINIIFFNFLTLFNIYVMLHLTPPPPPPPPRNLVLYKYIFPFAFLAFFFFLSACATNTNSNTDTLKPIFTSSGPFTVLHNAPIGTIIGAVVASNESDSISFSITDGNNDQKFSIDPSSGQITTSGSIDFNTRSTYSLSISATDSAGNTTTQTVSVSVIPPVQIDDQSFTINRFAAQETSIGTLQLTSPNSNNLSFGITIRDDKPFTLFLFRINPNTGEIALNRSLNFSGVRSSYTLTVRVEDSAENFDTAVITINVDSTDDIPPVITPNQSLTINEHAPINSVIEEIQAMDNISISFFSITAGDDDDLFGFGFDDLLEHLLVKKDIDFESLASPVFTLSIQATDIAGNMSAVETITVTIIDIDDNLPIIYTTLASINENSPIGTTVTTVSTYDNDISTLTYAITSDTSVFDIHSTTGVITNKVNIDFETTPTYTITLQVTDSDNNIATADITINVIDRYGAHFSAKFGSTGTGNSQFQAPQSIAVDDTQIYVVDATRDDVQIFNKTDNSFVTNFGSTGTGNSQFQFPQSIAVDDTQIYVVDNSRDDVQIFNKTDNSFVAKFGSTGTSDGQFQIPNSIAVDDTQIYVLDNGRKNVQIFNKNNRTYVAKLTKPDDINSSFNELTTITVDENFVYVIDRDSDQNIIVIYNKNIQTFSHKINNPGAGSIDVDANYIYAEHTLFQKEISIYNKLNRSEIVRFGATGTGDGQFQSIIGIAVNNTQIYVLDETRNDVQVFEIDPLAP